MKNFIFVLLLGVSLYSSKLNLKLTNSTLSLLGETGINNIKVRGEFIYNDNQNKHNFFAFGLKAEGNLIGIESDNIRFSLFVDGVHTKNNSALPLGVGFFSYITKVEVPLFIKLEYEYAPKVLSFNDADRFSRFDFSLGYYPIINAQLFVGYRSISFNSNYNSSFYGGIGFNF